MILLWKSSISLHGIGLLVWGGRNGRTLRLQTDTSFVAVIVHRVSLGGRPLKGKRRWNSIKGTSVSSIQRQSRMVDRPKIDACTFVASLKIE